MATTMDETTLSTLDLLQSRLLRVEHLLYGQSQSPALAQDRSATDQIGQLERRFSKLLYDFRDYHELMKICMLYQSLLLEPMLTYPLQIEPTLISFTHPNHQNLHRNSTSMLSNPLSFPRPQLSLPLYHPLPRSRTALSPTRQIVQLL